MDCPFCKYNDTKVIRTIRSDDGLTITRRRQCPRCGARFTTLEAIELQIIKHDGSREPFSRAKVINGVRKASQNLDIKDEDFKKLGLEVEEDLKARGEAEITSNEVGKAILKPLRDLNDVAYLRFASVYRNFSSLDDFKKAIRQLERYHRRQARIKARQPAAHEASDGSRGDADVSPVSSQKISKSTRHTSVPRHSGTSKVRKSSLAKAGTAAN